MALFGCASDEQYLDELKDHSFDLGDFLNLVTIDFIYPNRVNRTFVSRSHFDLDYIKTVVSHDSSCLGFEVHYSDDKEC